MRIPNTLWPVAVGLITAASSITAQESRTQEHHKLWGGFGLGGGWSTNTTLDSSAVPGGGFYLRFGGTPTQRLLLGFETIAWVRSEGIDRLTRGNGSFVALLYPSLSGGFYFKGAFGIAIAQVETELGNGFTTMNRRSGIGTTWGVGYDFRLRNNLYLTPNVDILFQAIGRGSATQKNTSILITLGIVWH